MVVYPKYNTSLKSLLKMQENKTIYRQLIYCGPEPSSKGTLIRSGS